MKTKSQLENTGITFICISITMMVLALVVGFVGESIAPRPALMVHFVVDYMFGLIAMGTGFNILGLLWLRRAKSLDKLESFPPRWHASP